MLYLAFLILISLLIIALCAIFAMLLVIYTSVLGHFFGAPFVPSKKEKIVAMLDLAEIKPGDIAMDLGSGDGALAIEAARRGAHAVGIEINPFLVWYSRWRIKKSGVKNATIVRQNYMHYPLSEADVVLIYLLPAALNHLKDKLGRELKPGVKIVSNTFAIPGWTATKEKGGVYLYKASN